MYRTRCHRKHAVCERAQAVIGAGAAGLVAARELLREGHTVHVIEQSERIGGIWDYSSGPGPPALPWSQLGLLPHCTPIVYELSHNLCKPMTQSALSLQRAEVESDDLLGLNPNRRRVHSSMYADLRTNLPRVIMGFSDFPNIPAALNGRSVDPRRFPSHPEVCGPCSSHAIQRRACFHLQGTASMKL